MANYQQLKNALVDVIKQNGNNEITGEIMQTTLLSMINSLGANYQFAGILTPSTSFVAPDENVFFIGGGGTYNNFGTNPIVVPNGSIGLFMYNGTYSSHVIQSNGVLDVSVLNAVNGTPTQYSTLQNALNAIPSELRYNGMEIIYIDSNTEQYVKYRMIAKEWSVLSTAWQGVDDEPTDGSDNLVTSGGVAKEFNDKLNIYEEKSSADYDQTEWNSSYQAFVLQANKKYRLTLTFTNWTALNSNTAKVFLYAHGTGSAEHIDITSLFGGASELIKGNPISIEYTPSFDVNYILTQAVSTYSPVEGCHVSAVAEEVKNKFDELDKKITEEKERAEQSESDLQQDIDDTKSLLVVYTEKARTQYSQTGWNSGYKEFALQANKKYRLSIQAIGFDTYPNDLNIELYASASGSAQHISIASLFGGSANITKGNMLNAEYIPTFDSLYMRSAYSYSSQAPTASNSLLLVAEEITENYAKKEEIGDLSELETTDKSNIVSAINSLLSNPVSKLPINIFGDILPTTFKNKLYGDDDLLIVCQGDSLTGLVQNCSQSVNPAHENPFGRYMHFVSMLQYNVCKIKPYYNRLDSQRDNTDVFTKVGTWAQVSESDFGPQGNPAIPDKYKDSSETSRTFRSSDANASISFVFDADTYNKCNIFFTKNIDAGNAEIVISEGNGKMLVSEDRVNWVEANGFTHSQALVGEYVFNGNPYVERQRRLWMKKVESATGEIHITYRRADTNTNYIYCWGTEMYKGRAILFDNIGRGGRTIELLAENIGDIFDRKPDLSILEMPLANDLYHATTVSELCSQYAKYFTDNADYSYKNRSNDFANYPIVIVLPHIRSTAFNGDSATFEGTTQTILTDPAYDIYKKVWGWLHTQLGQYDNVSFVNLLDQYLNEAKVMYGNYQNGLSGGNLTADSTHLNQRGSDLYVKYLAPIFQI